MIWAALAAEVEMPLRYRSETIDTAGMMNRNEYIVTRQSSTRNILEGVADL